MADHSISITVKELVLVDNPAKLSDNKKQGIDDNYIIVNQWGSSFVSVTQACFHHTALQRYFLFVKIYGLYSL